MLCHYQSICQFYKGASSFHLRGQAVQVEELRLLDPKDEGTMVLQKMSAPTFPVTICHISEGVSLQQQPP
jgi:hypothetical protein